MPHTAARLLPLLLAPAAALLLAAAPAPNADATPDDLIRRANAAFEAAEAAAAQGREDAAEQIAEADALYASAEELTTDPGLVAFNRAAVLARGKKFSEAAALYLRVLRDGECPPARAAAANYNRGTCLLQAGGSSRVYREAIRHLGLAHDSAAADAPLKARARDNLELAKALWKKAYDEEKKAGQKPENPNDTPPPDDPAGGPRPGDQDLQPGSTDPGGADASTATQQPMTQPNGATATNAGQTTEQGPAPGATPDSASYGSPADLQSRSPEVTRRILRDAAARLQKEQRVLDDSLYTSQLGVRDR